MNKLIALILPLLIVGCAENLDVEKKYEEEIIRKNINTSAEVKTKYFSGKLNYILILQDNNEPCIFDQYVSYILYFRDEDGFDIADVIESPNSGFTQKASNECERFVQDSITLDKELYKKITKVSFATRVKNK